MFSSFHHPVRLLSFIASAFLLTACGPAREGEEADEEFVSSHSEALIAGPTSVQLTDNCGQVVVGFKAPTSLPAGATVTRHEVERASSTSGPWFTVRTLVPTSYVGPDPYVLRNKQYYYRVRSLVRRSNGTSEYTAYSSTAGILTPACALPTANTGSTMKVSVFLFTPGLETHPFTKAQAEQIVFDSTNPKSMYTFLAEASGGVNRPAKRKSVRLTGRVVDWQKLSKPRLSDYPLTADMCADVVASGSDAVLKRNYPADYYVYVFNGKGGGTSYTCAGPNTAAVGSTTLQVPNAGYGTMAHELGHLIGLGHEQRMHCSGGVPKRVEDFKTSCSLDNYASTSSLMSYAQAGNHFSGYHKWRLGFLTNSNVAWTSIRSTNVDQTFDIEDSTDRRTATGVQLVALPFDIADNMYLLQYRTAQGLDSTLKAGVYVYIRPGQNLGIEDVALVHKTLAQPVILDASNTTYTDPYRMLKLTFQQSDSTKARVRVVRNPNYASL